MLVCGLAGASDFQTGNQKIPRLRWMIGVFLSTFVQTHEGYVRKFVFYSF